MEKKVYVTDFHPSGPGNGQDTGVRAMAADTDRREDTTIAWDAFIWSGGDGARTALAIPDNGGWSELSYAGLTPASAASPSSPPSAAAPSWSPSMPS